MIPYFNIMPDGRLIHQGLSTFLVEKLGLDVTLLLREDEEDEGPDKGDMYAHNNGIQGKVLHVMHYHNWTDSTPTLRGPNLETEYPQERVHFFGTASRQTESLLTRGPVTQ
jgi:hypothetical protein